MPRTQLEKAWLGAGALVALVMLLIGYFFFISPQRGQTAEVNGQIDTARMQNSALQAKINMLAEQNKDLGKYQARLKAAEVALPSTSGLPDFLRTLQSIGNSTMANVSSLTVGTPTDVTSLAGASAPAATSTTATPDSSSADSSSTDSSSTDSSSTANTTTAPTTTGMHVYALPISAQVSGTIKSLDDFLTQLQSVQPRAVLISQLSQSSAAGGSGTTSLSLTMQAFVAPASAVEQSALSAAAGK